MRQGAKRAGVPAVLTTSSQWRGNTDFDAVIFYGFAEGLRSIFEAYKKKKRAVYIDLGYWGRRKRTRWDGYHKMAVNNRHATAYFQNERHKPDRYAAFRLPVHPWRKSGNHIIVAGMSAKAAAAEGLRAEEWEKATIHRLRQLTDRPIIYRPKPNWPGARIIPGCQMQRDIPLDRALTNCHCVVTHHSNVGIDALVRGVPVISDFGLASVMGSRNLEDIENPLVPDGREQFLCDVAYTQYSVNEMADGTAIRYLLDEGLI